MKKIPTIVMFAFLAMATAIAGQQDVQENGIFWNFIYGGDAIPSEDSPARFSLDRHGENPVEEVASAEAGNSVLRQTIGSGGWGWRILGPSPLLREAPCLVFEMRARIVSGEGFLLGAELRNGDTGGASLGVSTNAIAFGSGSRTAPVREEIANDFHIYRMVLDSSGAKLYLDGNPDPLKEVALSPIVGIWVAFGNFGTLDGVGVVEYDYVKWAWSDEAPLPPGVLPKN
jgi:hypothetical protein